MRENYENHKSKMGVNGPKEETGHADSRLVKKLTWSSPVNVCQSWMQTCVFPFDYQNWEVRCFQVYPLSSHCCGCYGNCNCKKKILFCFNNENHIEDDQTKPYLSTWYQLTPSRQIWTVGGWHWNSFGDGGSISILRWHTLGGLWNSLGMIGAIPQTLFLRLSSHLKGLFRVTWVKTAFFCCNISRPKKSEPCSCIY